jgi:hypothetical protein
MNRRPDQKILQSVNDLVAAVTQLVSNVAENAGRAARRAADDARGVAEKAGRPAAEVGEKTKRLRAAIRAHWAGMSAKERAERVRRMLAGRGLKPAARGAAGRASGKAKATKGSQKTSRLRSALKAHWASMSPEVRAERVRRMLAGRGLSPKAVRRRGGPPPRGRGAPPRRGS